MARKRGAGRRALACFGRSRTSSGAACSLRPLAFEGESSMNPLVNAFLKREDKWRAEFEKLRAILLESGLTEELKWGQPCYSLDGKNVVLIHGFKEYCAILFHK